MADQVHIMARDRPMGSYPAPRGSVRVKEPAAPGPGVEEQHSDLGCCGMVQRGGAVAGAGIHISAVREELARDPGSVALLTVMWANNEVGTVNDIEAVAQLVCERAPGAVVHTDAIQAPCWLDAGAVMLRQPCVADWVAHTPVQLELLPAQALSDWYARQPAAARALLRDALNLHRQQTEAALALQTQDAEARCAQWLLRHARRDGEAITVPIDQPKRAIAAQLGITPETFSRVLRRLRETGLIREDGCTMNLLDAGGLRALAGR